MSKEEKILQLQKAFRERVKNDVVITKTGMLFLRCDVQHIYDFLNEDVAPLLQ